MHKTFHRYVIRAKRGTVQSQHDLSKFAKSAGANIRRSQEAAFKEVSYVQNIEHLNEKLVYFLIYFNFAGDKTFNWY